MELGASDIHLKVGQPPVLRRDGELGLLPEHPPLYDSDLEAALAIVADLTPAKLSHFHETGELDIAYAAEGLPRFRVNGYRQRGSISFAFRVIPSEVPSFDKLRLPKGVERLAEEHRGLVLVTGATGSGKTTTLAAVIDLRSAPGMVQRAARTIRERSPLISGHISRQPCPPAA